MRMQAYRVFEYIKENGSITSIEAFKKLQSYEIICCYL